MIDDKNTWTVLGRLKNKKNFSPDEVLGLLLKNRGISSEMTEEFLNPDLSDINPEAADLDIGEMEKASKRIFRSIEEKETIIIYSDYDCDGVCSAAILWETMNILGAKVFPYIPDRFTEGYGIKKSGIDKLRDKYGTFLIITSDNGISAHDEVAYAKKNGLDTIIVDHHEKSEKLPPAYSVIHTKKLAAAGIAYVFSDYLNAKKCAIPDFSRYLELAAIATVADLVPLTGINRVIAKLGINRINSTKRPGLRELIKQSGLRMGDIDSYSISHILAPRINAMGRLKHAVEALRLLCTNNAQRAGELAGLLCSTNRLRQEKTSMQYLMARSKMTEEGFGGDDKLIFINSNEYDEGVIGLIAGKLTEAYGLPSIVVSETGEICKASARSVQGFDIHQFIKEFSAHLTNFGGHKMAAGFSVKMSDLEGVKKMMVERANKVIEKNKLRNEMFIDLELGLDDLSMQLYEKLTVLSPFGVANAKPVFLSRGIIPISLSFAGSGNRHLKMKIGSGRMEHAGNLRTVITGGIFDAIGFGMGEKASQIPKNQPVDMLYTLEKDSWNGRNSLILYIKDVKLSEK